MHVPTIVPFTTHTFLFSPTSESPRFHLRFLLNTGHQTLSEHAAVWNAHAGDWFQVPVNVGSLINAALVADKTRAYSQRCASQTIGRKKYRNDPGDFIKCAKLALVETEGIDVWRQAVTS